MWQLYRPAGDEPSLEGWEWGGGRLVWGGGGEQEGGCCRVCQGLDEDSFSPARLG